MSETNKNRTEHLHVRFTKQEFEIISNRFSRSTCRKLSEYVRKVMLDKPIKVQHRNQSLDDFMTEIIVLRTELNAIGNNYNQLIKRLHTLTDFAEIKTWLVLHESARKILIEKIEQIKQKINSINDQWLQ